MYLFSYDLENDKERRRLSNLLKGYGTRVQKSVFECPVSKSRYLSLCRKIEELDLTSGFVLVYRLQAQQKRKMIGVVPDNLRTLDNHSFVI